MKTILVPTDFSAVSRNATLYAGQLAKALGAKIVLFHTYMIPAPTTEMLYMMVSVDEIQKEHEERIKKDAARLFSNFNVEVEWEVRIGIPSEEIKLLVMEKAIDLVVMATHGEGGLDKIIGSTTRNVIRKIKTPVLIIPQNAAFSPIDRITYASDFTYDTSLQLFNPLLEFINAFNSKLNILHVYKQQEKPSIDEVTGKKDLDEIFKDINHEFNTVSDPDITHGINGFIEKTGAGLLAMVAHKHTFLERIFSRNNTSKMAYETKIPLLALQDKK